MTEEQRRNEIREVRKLIDEVEALAHYQIAKALRARSLLARLEGDSEQVKAVEGCGSSSNQGTSRATAEPL